MTQLRLLTWSDYDEFMPCYDPTERYGEFEGTILDILKDERIPDDDKIWAFTRKGIVDDRTLRKFACRCVREIWHLLTDDRSRNAVEVAERYADGLATDDERAAARASARASARAAARASARAAAEAAAEAAAWAAAGAAAGAAAREAARAKQVQIAIELLEGAAR